MCASLRTLLAYEDTAFDVPARREVDRAISDGDVASATLEKIRSVRSDGFIAPPTNDSRDGLDPNITAEYLDHTLSENEVAPFETLCMTSDTILAEVAACHAIISKRLGSEIHVDHLGRLRCYAVTGMSPPENDTAKTQDTASTQDACKPSPVTHNRSGDVAACLREGKAKNRRLIFSAAASVTLLVVAIALYQRPTTVRVDNTRPLPDSPSSIESFVFDDAPPPMLRATFEPSVTDQVVVAGRIVPEQFTPHADERNPLEVPSNETYSIHSFAAIPTQFADVPLDSATTTSRQVTNQQITLTTPAPPEVLPPKSSPVVDEAAGNANVVSEPVVNVKTPPTSALPSALPSGPPSRRTNPLRPDVTVLPSVTSETETPELVAANSPTSPPPLSALPVASENATTQTVAWEPQKLTDEFLEAKELPTTIDTLVSDSESRLQMPSAARLAIGNEGDTTIPKTVAFVSESPRVQERLITAGGQTIAQKVATIEPAGPSLVFLATTPDTPWRATTESSVCPSGGYVLTVAPFQASLSLVGGGNVRLIGDCKVSFTQTHRTVTLGIDYGRCVITLPPSATSPVMLRIETERGGGFITLPPGKGIVFVDTFAQRGTTSPPPIAFHDTETLRQHCEAQPRSGMPRDVVVGFLPESSSDVNGETVFIWRADTMRDAIPVRQPIAVILGHDAAAGYATSIPTWLTTPPAPSSSRLIAAWRDACSTAKTDDVGDVLGVLNTNRAPEVRSLALRLWGDLGHFKAPLTAFNPNGGDDAVRGVMSVYFREVLRRDSETIVRLNDTINE